MLEDKFALCFKISSLDGKNILVTDQDSKIISGDEIFRPNSGLELESSELDESGVNRVVLKGFFEDDGISRDFKLEGSFVSIYVFEKSKKRDWMRYKCIKTIKDNVCFKMILAPITFDYNQQIILLYGRKCRANFGDAKCKMNPDDFVQISCDKSFTMCANIYNNIINFRGEPFIPTFDYFNGLDE
ncbi:MAG: DUF2163 domain-containing protein [Rickettsiaceae bacterium]|nr:DUF2163 domain-containing protein [Rickettsiaceae bacterium]